MDLGEVQRVGHALAIKKEAAIEEMAKAVEQKGQAEASYRELLAKALVKAKADHGTTLALSFAKGEPEVARAKRDSLVAEGMVNVHRERLRLLEEQHTRFVQQVGLWRRAVESE